MLQLRTLVVLVGLAFLAPNAVLSQSPLGTITGTVQDPQGASVPAVEVSARHVDTNRLYKGRTSEDGVYVIPSLPIGAYEVSLTAPGFKSFIRSGLVLEVAQRLRVDVTLEVGAVGESITVASEVARVQTEDSSLGTVIERQRIENLPLNGRHVFNLVKLIAGVQPRFNNTDGFAEVSNQNFSQIRFNGGPVYGTQVYMDGGVNTAAIHGEIAVVPMADAVEEFKVETNSLKAEFGQTSGGVVNVVTKSGSNELHGSLYEFLRNDALDARNAFAIQPDSLGRLKPILRYNQYGGTVGGPVMLPKLYNGRNRTFFFGGYEQWRLRRAGLNRGTVATALERNGDFSNTRDSQGRLITIYDPATTTPLASGGFSRQPFPGNVIPRNRMDPLALRVLELYPLPNATPDDPFTNLNNFLALPSNATDQGVTSVRIDHRFSDQDTVFGRYSGTRNTSDNPGYGLGPADPNARLDQRDNHTAVITETHVFSPAILNEFKASVSRHNLDFSHPGFDGDWPAKLGYPSIIPQDAFPAITIQGLLSMGGGTFAGGTRATLITQVANTLTLIRGNHSIKAGFDHNWYQQNWANRRAPSGQFSFTTGQTNNPQSPAGTGFGMASFLLGEVGGGLQAFNPFFSFHNWTSALFVQDDWKVTRRLTLNLGLRYDLTSAPRERHNRYSNFEPYTLNPETRTNGAITYAGVTRRERFVNPNRDMVGPRFGFAYDITGKGKTVVRGGYGLVYMQVVYGDTEADTSNALGFASETAFAPNGPFRAFQFSAGPDRLNIPVGAAGGPSIARGQNTRVQVEEAPAPYLQQWNLSLQHALPGAWVVGASYAGNRGVKMFGANYNLNQLDPQYLSLGLALQDQVPNPFRGQILTGPLSGATITRAQSLRPLPDYLDVMTMANHGASSIYHSVQVTVEKRYSKGLTALVSFTGGKLINDSFASAGSAGGALAGVSRDFRIGLYNRRLDRSLDPDDVSRRLVASGVYELPFGRGKALLAGSNAFVNQLVGGWKINAVWTAQTGFPLAIRGANNQSGINWPDVLYDPTLPSSERTVTRWFDTDAFRNPAPFTIGNVPRQLPRTRGPGLNDVAFSAFKVFDIVERFKLEFRGELFNALNNVNYENPGTTFTPNAAGVNQNAAFGRITSALNARSVQLGLRLTF
jgi:hypothetical protein